MRCRALFANTLIGLSVAAFGWSSSAIAAPIYSEDFNSPLFVGSSLGLTGSDLTSDRWASTTYYNINNADGWTFAGGAYLAQETGTGDGALLLNENGGVASILYGLTIGQTYTLSMLLSGDNRPGGTYVLDVNIGGTLFQAVGADLAAGANPGTLLTYNFVATASSETLLLSQEQSTGEASPIVDNITVTAVPEPSALVVIGLALLSLVGFGTMRRRTDA